MARVSRPEIVVSGSWAREKIQSLRIQARALSIAEVVQSEIRKGRIDAKTGFPPDLGPVEMIVSAICSASDVSVVFARHIIEPSSSYE